MKMSPASKSKGKDKSSAKATKELHKASPKPSATGSAGNGLAASAYNPLSGTFHTLETAPTASSPPTHSNGRFKNIDETDDHSGSSFGTGAEYDSVSNNDSCSGESEDLKEKAATTTTVRQEAIPGSDNDKREKIRQKNERKHQRQRERRAQELHERCSGYLMSRKLEALAQQLVAMGFSSERATMALILNEGRIEESLDWLFNGSEETSQQKDSNIDPGSNLKLDITEELNKITDMEIKYKCSKQEVERAVVTCEGDLEKASDIMKAQKHEPPTCPPKPGEFGDPPMVNGGKVAVSSVQNPGRSQVKSSGSIVMQQRRDDRDFNYTKAPSNVVPAPEAVVRNLQSESANRNVQSLRRIQPKSEWVRPQVPTPVEKRWPNGVSGPSVSYSLASPLQAAPPPSKVEPRYVAGSEAKNPPTGSVREPVIMMQRPQSINVKQNHPATSVNTSIPASTQWYPSSVNGVEMLKPNGVLQQVPSSTSIAPNSLNSQQFYVHPHQQTFMSNPVDTPGSGWGNSYSAMGQSLSPSPSPSSLAVPSSLGLFSGWGATGISGSSSPVDWNTGGSIPQCDYTNIDWTLESTIVPTRSNRLWSGIANIVKNSGMYDSWSSASNSAAGQNPAMRLASSNGVRLAGLQEGVAAETSASTSEGPHEWTSPFAGKDLFRVPRQFVTSPSP